MARPSVSGKRRAILEALAQGPASSRELAASVGNCRQCTMGERLSRMSGLGLVRHQRGPGGSCTWHLEHEGLELLRVDRRRRGTPMENYQRGNRVGVGVAGPDHPWRKVWRSRLTASDLRAAHQRMKARRL